MMLWNLYFMLKLYLWLSGRLEPLWVTNIAFALALAVTAFVRGRQWRLLRTLIGLAVGLPLMYREAVVPPFARLVEELGAMAHFSMQYWLELAPRFVPPFMLGAAGIVVLLYLVVNRWARVSTLVSLRSSSRRSGRQGIPSCCTQYPQHPRRPVARRWR